jgi:hypothetical protein
VATSARVESFAPAKPDRTFAILTRSDPARFYPAYGPLPAVTAVENQTGAWDAAGQSRTLRLGDGSTVIERLRVVDAPRRFAYQLTDFTGFFGNLVAFADAEWDFDASIEGTRIRWSYTFHAQPKRGWVVRLIVTLLWSRYMRRVLPALVDEVRRAPPEGARG